MPIAVVGRPNVLTISLRKKCTSRDSHPRRALHALHCNDASLAMMAAFPPHLQRSGNATDKPPRSERGCAAPEAHLFWSGTVTTFFASLASRPLRAVREVLLGDFRSLRTRYSAPAGRVLFRDCGKDDELRLGNRAPTARRVTHGAEFRVMQGGRKGALQVRACQLDQGRVFPPTFSESNS
jgi:hypothetical protein